MRAAGEQRGHVPRVGCAAPCAQEVDAAVDFVERPLFEAASRPDAAHACIQQLPPRHHAVLAARQRRDGPVTRLECAIGRTYTVPNPTLDGGAPARSSLVGCRAARRARSVRFDDFVQGGALSRLAAGGASGGDQLRRVEPDAVV